MQEKKVLTLDEIKALLLEMMEEVDHFCREHQIEYSLYGGSLIGAIRHKGFIPWDDDMDIIMPRKDYERFLKEYPKYDHGHYRLIDRSSHKKWMKPFAKVYDTRTNIEPTWLQKGFPNVGVAIDIIPVDEVRDKEALDRLISKENFWKMLLDLRVSVPKPSETKLRYVVKRILYRFIVLLPVSFFTGRMEKMAQAYGGEASEFMGIVAYPFDDDREVSKKEYYDEMIDVPFEDCTFRVLKEYDAYLTGAYGDYMAMPPVEMQVNHLDKEPPYWV